MNDIAAPSNSTPGARTAGEHPSADAWIAYHAGQLSKAEGDRMQDHLAQCRQCLDLVLDLDRFIAPGSDDVPGVSDFEKAAVWRAFHNARHAGTAARRPAVAALAAAVLFAALGLTVWIQQQRAISGLEARVADLSTPRVDAVIEDLWPNTQQRGAGGAGTTTDLSAEATNMLILNLDDPADYPDHALTIVDAAGSEVRRIRGFALSKAGNFNLTLPPRSLLAGRYDVRVFGLDGDRQDLLASFPVRLHEE